MSKINYKEIKRPINGRRFAISDIHGCANTFKALLEKINFNQGDHLYLVGDLINRGPHSDEVLDHILHLLSEDYEIYTIRGNHEQIILKSQKKSLSQRKRIVQSYRSENLLNKAGNLKKRYRKFLKATFHYLILEDYYLVHAGFNFESDQPFEDSQFMLYTKKFKARKKFLKDKKVIIGHTPNSISKIENRIKNGKRKIIIDNGCVNYQVPGLGNLICINLDSLEITSNRNIDQK